MSVRLNITMDDDVYARLKKYPLRKNSALSLQLRSEPSSIRMPGH